MKAAIAVLAAALVVTGACLGVFYHRISALDSRLTATQAKLTGQRPDVITCTDLRHLAMSGISSDGAQVATGYENGGGANGVSLPSHCYNP